jgi:Domain of unknown function (DUF6398)
VSSAVVSSTPGVSVAVRPAYEAVRAQLDAFAKAHLPEEYLPVLNEAALTLARKRPSPLLHGQPVSWACGIAHAIGAVNFLFDTTQEGHLSAAEIARGFGVGVSTGAAKAAEVRKHLKMSPPDLRWQVPSMLEKNPLVRLVQAGVLSVPEAEPPPGAAPFIGTWRILEMAVWGRDWLDADGPAFIAFQGGALGDLRFGTIQGDLDCRFGEHEGKPLVEFSWQGISEMDPACGRGWAMLDSPSVITGKIFIHLGDDSAFTAEKSTPG